ncbi:bifunctional [glutamine synthetase] adenylyltransferase/[glutamine synthetase]-adenylyl-L-tyrosine phosphorylase [Amycolatopsis magusensis]|uniref:Bifunctional glutamine synthetase adenylyltransferase/adenylyl-removing enzyme n=1 Tax=Amycolatopsis magusensis TaxID=882444 RepID=A0ABS4Q5Y7_9PSEU|nr:bifunctional [glutamine synthetase] adenylyltransferase/[glutamine synthetase]-adenylyl-L-tyrosine phosphorylase [Amycolatopsis magusensis]MBP2187096.1 glutamate-ammonia-ligase adenylyltransferase [Amycolatopsis magusensis]MDI5981838.1 bifunctional [glutamine synthetase] adenylyltransferase/[glutamine synthetase]-adenylyl-L-tyrosine phosphorylase [Amycolatopsis magusensis]
MADRSRSKASVARFGFTDDRAEEQLSAVGLWSETGPAEGADDVLLALSRGPDADLAVHGLDRLREADERAWPELADALRENAFLRGRLLAVLGTSSALADFLVGSPDQWQRLTKRKLTAQEQYTEELVSAVEGLDGTEAEQALRAGYRGLLLEIAAADLGHIVDPELGASTYTEITHRLTALAEAALRAGLVVAEAETNGPERAKLAVIAMGKCGGRELNYVSDVDVVFVGDGDLQVGTRIASKMMGIVGKACFEVDAALRPEGKAGALVRTLDGHDAYYKKWARTWEFQALLKARPVAGDEELGAQYCELIAPMVWAAAERENFVGDVQRMRRRVEGHVPSELVERELKLGRGGLRDVEFAVQLLQLVHGRVDPDLRSSSTLEALAALGESGYVGRADAAELEGSYEFLRSIEHRLQLRRLRRTHLFPDTSETTELRWLARASGIRPSRGRSEAEALVAEFKRHGQRIRRLHEKLFYRPLLESVARVPTGALRLTTKEASSRLNALGYAAPDGALHHIKALTSGVSRRASIQQALLPVLLDLLADTPDPDGGLLAYRKVSEALAETPWYLRVLRDEGAVVERLAFLLGTSKLVPDLLVRAPEVLQLLGAPDRLAGRSPREVATSLRAAVRRQPGLNAAVTTARSLRRHELLRVASADLLGLMDVVGVCEALSSVWAAVLQGTLAAAIRKRVAELGAEPAAIAVIGMGRLGGSELGYGSDADVLFVCEPVGEASDADAVKFASSVAETVRKVLGAPSSDPALEVDTNLRPEGRNGPLVRTLESYRAYYARWAEVWEAQALLRARFVAGDADLGERFIAAIDPVRYPADGLDSGRAREVRRIKARVDTERMPKGADPTTHTKLGRGGLADVEWTAQLAQLRYAHRFPALRTTSTVEALRAMAHAELASEGDIESLVEAWMLATRVRNAGMLVRGKAVDQIPGSGRELAAVAMVFDYSADDDPGEFLDFYRRTTRRAHAVVERLFYDD